MVLQQLFRFSSILRSALSVHLRRNIGMTAVAFNQTKELDPVQKLFVDKIREYRTKSQKSGGIVDAGADYQSDLNADVNKLQTLFGGGNLDKFPDLKFEEPKLEEGQK